MDLDESMDVFKKPSRFGRAPKPRSTTRKKVQAREQRSKTAAVALPTVVDGISDGVCLKNKNAKTRDQLVEDASDSEERPAKFLKVCPSKVPVHLDENLDYYGAHLKDGKDISQSCKTCGKLFRLSELSIHVPACLRLNFEACRRAGGNSDNIQDVVGDHENRDRPSCSHESTKDGHDAYFCPTCACDLSLLSQEQRNIHANRCLDHAGQGLETEKHVNKGNTVLQGCLTSGNEYRCLLCTKLLKSSAGLKKHFVACQKRNKFTTMTALTLHRPESGVEVDMEIMAEITKAKEQKVDVPKPSKKIVRKGPAKADPAVYEHSMFQLALAASNGDDLTSKRHKKQKGVVIPVMLTLSPNSKKRDLKERMRRILTDQVDEGNDIPSTPGLPKSALSTCSLRAAGFVSGVQNRHVPKENEAEKKGQSMLESLNCVATAKQLVQEGSQSPPSQSMHSRPHRASPVNIYENELQSPEVSSSNMKAVCLSDANDSPGRNSDCPPTHGHEREVRCNESHPSEQNPTAHESKLTKWTMTNCEPNDPEHKNEPPEIVPNTLSDGPGSSHDGEDGTSGSGMNRTLAHLVDLENSVMSDAMQSCSSVAKCKIGGKKYPGLSNVGYTGEDAITWPVPNDQNTSSDFKAFLGNPLYSDAKLVIGQMKDELHVHKMILFYRCRLLLEEIEMSGNNTLFLPEYEKSAFFPFMKYIYTNKLEASSIFTGMYKSDAVMLTSIAKRFAVELPLSSQHLPQGGSEDINVQEDDPHEANDFAEGHHYMDEDFLSQPSPTQKCLDVRCPSLSPSSNQSGFGTTYSDHTDLDADILDMPVGLGMETDPTFASSLLPTSVSNRSLGSYDRGPSLVPADQGIGDINGIHSELLESDFIAIPEMNPDPCNDTTANCRKVSDVPVKQVPERVQYDRQKSPIDHRGLAASSPNIADGTPPSEGISSVSDSDLSYLGNVGEFSSPKPSSIKNADHKCKDSSKKIDEKMQKGSSNFNDCQPHVPYHTLRRKRKNLKKCSLNCCRPDDTSVDKYVKEKLPRFRPREFRHHPAITTRMPRQAGKLKKRRSSREMKTRIQYVTGGDGLQPAESIAISTKENRAGESKHSSCSKVGNGKHKKKFSSTDDALCKNNMRKCEDESLSNKAPLKVTSASDCSLETASYQKASPMCNSLITTNPSPCSRRGRKRSCEGAHKSEMVYVSERLPRFKQREHIKNRPGVANMGKATSKIGKSVKREPTYTKRVKKESREQKDVSVSMSQLPKPTEFHDSMLTSNHDERKYRFKRPKSKHLRDYASLTPDKIKIDAPNLDHDNQTCGSESDASIDSTGYLSDSVVDFCTNDAFDKSLVKKCDILSDHKDIAALSATSNCGAGVSHTPLTSRSVAVGPVPITPMMDFNEMETPEIYRHAEKYGLKKCLGKVKLKSKFEEVYRYSHQTLSDDENVPHNRDGLQQREGAADGDDLACDVRRWKLELSPFSAKPVITMKPVDVYSFTSLTISEVNELSSKVVERMHADMTLLSALQEAKQETGSIRRGSRRDQERCWDIVTPGSSGYDPKMIAILSLSEEYHSAITGPLVNCVVKNYLEYKKYMFDCLPALCDRMEQDLS